MSVALAASYAAEYHQGQYRKASSIPYVAHPENVVRILGQLGVRDEATLCIAWLHDTLEDTVLTYDALEAVFGSQVAQGVLLLTRNVDREEYKARLAEAPTAVQFVKLADTLDNVLTLDALSPQGVQRKVEDCQAFYIPLAREICAPLATALHREIN